jgi:hypothetical protein
LAASEIIGSLSKYSRINGEEAICATTETKSGIRSQRYQRLPCSDPNASPRRGTMKINPQAVTKES